MAINVQTAYSGQVLNKILVKLTTSNELVERGMIRIEPNVKGSFHIPRMKAGKFLQKVKSQPTAADSKGTLGYDEKTLTPKEFMAYQRFNPDSFKSIWEPFAVKGELVYAELPTSVQGTLLECIVGAVDFELGWHFINGEYKDGVDDDYLMNGILTRIVADPDVIKATVTLASGTTIKDKFDAVYKKIPKAVRKAKGLKFICSVEDWDAYDDYLSNLPNKGADPTSTNVPRYKTIPIEALSDWPEGVIVAVVATMDQNSNLWAGVNMVDDFKTVKIGPVTNDGDEYFIKMKMSADTQLVFGEECVLLDTRTSVVSRTKSGKARTNPKDTAPDPVVTGGDGDGQDDADGSGDGL